MDTADFIRSIAGAKLLPWQQEIVDLIAKLPENPSFYFGVRCPGRIRARTYEVEKRNKRLHIIEVETGKIVYTPPDFVKLPDRLPLRILAATFNVMQRRDIEMISSFESIWTRPHVHGARNP
jgi:hypothetical protein